MFTYYRHCNVVEFVLGRDGLVRRVVIEYYIPSAKSKQICVDISRLVVLPKIANA